MDDEFRLSPCEYDEDELDRMPFKRKMIIIGIVGLAFVILLIFTISAVLRHFNRVVTEYTVEYSDNLFSSKSDNSVFKEQENEALKKKVAFHFGNDRLMISTIDGAYFIDGKGLMSGRYSYAINEPVGDFCNDSILVYDYEGTKAMVLIESKAGLMINSLRNILRGKVSGNGKTVLYSSDDRNDYVTVYNAQGEVENEIRTTFADGIPVDYAISDDGTRLVTAYCSYENNKIVSKLSFYNFAQKGYAVRSPLTGQETIEGKIITRVVFAGRENIIAFNNNGFELYEMRTTKSKLLSKNFEDETVLDYAYDATHFGVVLKDMKTGKKRVVIYDYIGREIKSFNETAFSIDFSDEIHIALRGEQILLSNSKELGLYTLEGKCKALLKFEASVSNCAFAGEDRFFITSGDSIEILKLKR
ncbi:MAG: DUF5711 family protein [Lachnospiraceae bacterium]|nr:DUF5711 family protein [Lachnospiraceae bacterium]